MPRDVLHALIRAAAPASLREGQRDAWISEWSQEWDRRWEAAEAASRGEQPRPRPPAPVIEHASAPPAVPNTIGRLAPEIALAALAPISDKAVREIAARHVYIAREPVLIGHHEQTSIGVYLDLHTASCDPKNRETLAQFLAGQVERAVGRIDAATTVIATPREGNTLVTSRVAELCGTRFLMVRTFSRPRFGFPIEGTFTEGQEALLVDDLVMGTLIPRTANLLRTHAGLATRRCVSIFERADVGARETVSVADVHLDAAYAIDDDLIAALRRTFDQYH
ncbi:hypothetical protein ACFV9G_12970 [Nocardioides sp. NPDC059952]|uniref:hypothetical protein n=1 Tax=Nocardioides sp. NPDC059952 TaxID=3347014 RepID=UPI00364AD7F6